MLVKWGLENCDVDVVKVNLKRAEYEDRIVRLVKALLEIDELVTEADDTGVSEKEAA